MAQIRSFYKDKRIFITGHTGFKGIWLTSILLEFGAKIIGLSLNDKKKKLFKEYVEPKKVKSYFGNVENYNFLEKIEIIPLTVPGRIDGDRKKIVNVYIKKANDKE